MKVRKNNLKKPFMEHLQELNNRILVSAAFTVFTAVIVYIQYSFFVNLLLDPLINAGYDESNIFALTIYEGCLLYTSPSPRDQRGSRMPSSA